jgi:hypothetical protein
MVTALFSDPKLWAGIDIGTMEGSSTMRVEQHAGFGSGILVLRLEAEPNGEYFFGLEDFSEARKLAAALNAWADFAEPEYQKYSAKVADQYNRGKVSNAGTTSDDQ